jgi:hypothetical protein
MSVNTLQIINNGLSIVNTQQLSNNDKWQAKSALDDDECIVKFDGELDILLQLDFCPSKNGNPQTCSCIHVLHDPNICWCWSVSKYLLAFFVTTGTDIPLMDAQHQKIKNYCSTFLSMPLTCHLISITMFYSKPAILQRCVCFP